MARQLRSARELVRARETVHEETPLPTSCPAVDELLAGGLGRGQLTELVGGRGSGRFGLVLATLAATTAAGEVAALIDLGDHLDVQAAQAAGCACERLLWVRPQRLREALAATEMALQSGFVLIVLELGCPPLPGGRGSESAWLRLQRAAVAQGAALLVSSPYRISGTAATTVLRAEARHGRWAGRGTEPRLLAALDAALALEKSRRHELGTAGHRRIALTWHLAGSLAEQIAAAEARAPRQPATTVVSRSMAIPRKSAPAPRDLRPGRAQLDRSSGRAPLDRSPGLAPLAVASGLAPLAATSGLAPLADAPGLAPLVLPPGLVPAPASQAGAAPPP